MDSDFLPNKNNWFKIFICSELKVSYIGLDFGPVIFLTIEKDLRIPFGDLPE